MLFVALVVACVAMLGLRAFEYERGDQRFSMVDVAAIGILVWWVVGQLRRRRREREVLTDFSKGHLAPRPVVPVHSIDPGVSPSGERWLPHLEQWTEDFARVQEARARGDLGPVEQKLDFKLLAEMRAEVASAEASGPLGPVRIRHAEPVDSWEEGSSEFVSVRFVGTHGSPGGSVREFDETWTFVRPRVKPADTRRYRSAWTIRSIRRRDPDQYAPRVASMY
jgi:hypothetical protein